MTTPRLTRSQWGAAEVPASRPTTIPATKGTGVHWVGPGIYGDGRLWDHSLCAGKIRGIQRLHMAGEWYDIAYSEVVCPHGTRYEGRGYHVQTGANGSSYANRNWYAILALVGKGDPITARLLEGIQDALDAYRAKAGAGPEVTYHGRLLRLYADKSTECPGPVLTSKAMAGRFWTPPTTPSTTPTPTMKGSKMPPFLIQQEGQDAVYLTDLMTHRHVRDQQELADVRTELERRGLPTKVQTVKRMGAYGVLVGPAPKASA